MDNNKFNNNLAFSLACDYIAELTGSCPFDSFDWQEAHNCAGCDSRNSAECWREYFVEKATEQKKEADEWLNGIKKTVEVRRADYPLT